MASEKKVSLKLLIDPKSNKVLFAEAGREFVDFLFQIMSLPVGKVVTLVTPKAMVGSLGRLHESIQGLIINSDCLKQKPLDKDSVLNPSVGVDVPLLSLCAPPPKRFFRCYKGCSSADSHLTDDQWTLCSTCGKRMCCEMYLRSSESSNKTMKGGEYVKETVRYMVMDNLEVQPMSTSLVMGLMNKSRVVNVGSLVQKEVEVGLAQGIAMLKASLETEAVLTTVFLRNKA